MEGFAEKSIFENYSYDIFHTPKTKEDEIRVYFPTYYKYISRTFPNKLDALKDKEVVSMNCYKCNKKTRRKIKWFSGNNGKHYYAVSRCDRHGLMKGKIRIRKDINDRVYVVKTMRFISEEEMNLIKKKQEKVKCLKEKKRLGSR